MKTKTPLYIAIAIILILIISVYFGKGYLDKEYKTEINKQKKVQDSIIKLSEFKEDSLIGVAESERLFSDELQEQNNLLQNKNNSLYYELKKAKRKIFVIDTAFITNARRIAESSDRFYKENDSIR